MDEVREELAETPTQEEADAVEAVEGEAVDAPEDEAEAIEEIDTGEATDKVKVIKDSRLLRVALSDHELVEQAKVMIAAMDDAERARRTLKVAQADCKAAVEEAMERASEAEGLIRSKHEDRDTPCEQILNWTRGQVYVRRTDTGEILQVREMMQHERQLVIEDDEAAPAEDVESEAEGEVDGEETGELVGVGAGEVENEG